MENVRRWSGFVCPDCRSVFRVPRDYDGKGIVCPGCRRMMRIPGEGDVPPPLMAATLQVEEEEGGKGETVSKHRRAHVKKRVPSGDLSWESEGSRRRRHGEKKVVLWMLAAGVPLFAFVIAALIYASRGSSAPPAPRMVAVLPDAVGFGEAAVEEEIPLPEIMNRSEHSIREEAEPLARKFLEASTVEEILPFIHDPASAEPKLREYYPDGKIEAPGLAVFDSGAGLNFRESIVSVPVLTRDFEQREMIFVDTPEGLKVYWESWTGWSEMPWEDFMEKRPETSVVFRLILRRVEYYNFDFSDESRWQSYSLASPDGMHLLYGYVEKGSVLNERIIPSGSTTGNALMLALKYPEDARSRNQVEIESLVADGWVEGDFDSP